MLSFFNRFFFPDFAVHRYSPEKALGPVSNAMHSNPYAFGLLKE